MSIELPETDHHIVISADSHCGADLRGYKPYLEKKYHLVAFTESEEFKGYNISNNKLPWELDEIINQNFEITSEVINKFTPHELGYHLNTRIDFEKGCYTGQEIVARMHYRAKKLPEILVRSTNKEVNYIGRNPAASPASGYLKKHLAEQNEILEKVLGKF